eukprot:3966362-Amphidinium_carterae.1
MNLLLVAVEVRRDERGIWSFNAAQFSGQKAAERKPAQWDQYSPELGRWKRQSTFTQRFSRMKSNLSACILLLFVLGDHPEKGSLHATEDFGGD